MQRFLLLIFCFILFEPFTFAANPENEVYKVGVILPLTGSSAFWGASAKNAILLAVQDINDSGGIVGKKLEPIFEDEKCEPMAAVRAYHKLSDIDNVNIIIGAICSSSTLAIAPLAERHKDLLITPCSEAAQISAAGDYIFRLWVPNDRQGVLMADYLWNNEKIKSVAILAMSNDFGNSISRAFIESYKSLGGKISSHDEYLLDEKDFKPQLLKIASQKPEALYLISYPADGAIVVKQKKTLGLKIKTFTTSGIDSNDFFTAVGNAADGMIFAEIEDSTTIQFRERYASTYHLPWPGIGSCASTSYDAMLILAKAINEVGISPSAVKDFLYKLRDFNGTSGNITFDNSGDLIRAYRLFIIKNGKAEALD